MSDDHRLTQFEDDVCRLINHYSLENASDTPDFLLAGYLRGCLELWNTVVRQREDWYGRPKWGERASQPVEEPQP
jgi:hypothetical protein